MSDLAKKEVMLALLSQSEAQVHLDARHPDVRLPLKLKQSGHVRLDYGYSLLPSIPDLVVDDAGIAGTLSFNRAPTETFIPWSAVYLIADFSGRGAVWRGDVPADVVISTEDAEDQDEDDAQDDAPIGLRDVSEPASKAPIPSPAPAPKSRPNHLKLVK